MKAWSAAWYPKQWLCPTALTRPLARHATTLPTAGLASALAPPGSPTTTKIIELKVCYCELTCALLWSTCDLYIDPYADNYAFNSSGNAEEGVFPLDGQGKNEFLFHQTSSNFKILSLIDSQEAARWVEHSIQAMPKFILDYTQFRHSLPYMFTFTPLK